MIAGRESCFHNNTGMKEFHVEREVTFDVPSNAVSSVCRIFDSPSQELYLDSCTWYLENIKHNKALYVFMCNDAIGASDRLVLEFDKKDRLKATYTEKRWEIVDGNEVKLESTNPKSMNIDESVLFLSRDRRLIISSFVKIKTSLCYNRGLKIRLDCIIPVEPENPLKKLNPFWNMEVEIIQSAVDPSTIAAKFFEVNLLDINLPRLKGRKMDRARCFQPAMLPDEARELEKYLRMALNLY